LNKVVDVVFTVTGFTVLNEVVSLLTLETTSWVRELEGPEEVVGLLEVWTNSVDFVNEIFNTDNTVFTEFLSNDSIVSDWDSLLVNLSETTLVDKFTNGLKVWSTVGNVWFD